MRSAGRTGSGRRKVEVVVVWGAHQPLGLFDKIQQLIGRADLLADGGPDVRVVDGGVEEDQRQLAEEGHLLVGGPRGALAELVELPFRLSNYLKKDRRCWRRYHSKMQATLISPR